MALLEVDNLATYFHTRNGVVRAVDGVSFSLEKGKTLGIVGESGSGKSVSCYSLLGLIPTPPGRIESGSAIFNDRDLLKAGAAEIRKIRGRRISMIFQDPMTALNPYMTIGAQLIEPLRIHSQVSKSEAVKKAITMLEAVGIQDAPERMKAYPHHFSGGMRQRVVIAMALITEPDLLIADEPTTALDVTVQAQVLELISSMQKKNGMAVILVTHDLGVIAGTCDDVLVMYAGKICESASANDLFAAQKHPYTEALLNSLPSIHTDGKELYTIPGMPPDLTQPISGCSFAPRCEHANDRCRNEIVQLKSLDSGHSTACIRVQEGTL
ncbi:ABC transporter ATP-binding protein [bacterium AH-315-P07]|nr:ABC transporter ATP-binding protein [bacterium AH-315-P07]